MTSNVSSSKMTTGTRFTQFLSNIMLTSDQQADGQTKHGGVRRCLNEHYYNLSSGNANSLLVGSWGKSTEVRPPRDIDVLFVLPDSVRERFENRPWGTNKQSELLQEVKRVLTGTYPRTKMRGDGQVVLVQFESYAVEVAPAFKEKGILVLETGKYLICDTNDGGRYKATDPVAEQAHVRASNDKTSGNARALVRMAKKWQDHCNVPMKSFWLELLAVKFLAGWEHAGKSTVYYDWMVRDFFSFLVEHADRLFNSVEVPGTGETLWLGSEWKSRAETAHARAKKACEFESAEKPLDAGLEWQNIFGDDMPIW